ncbi:MarR family winged helix-turn-helix transcriptional regulator [Priestia megaterium]|uniref:MarR family winged helix-turn-helix transcriptional regulator n=1 Tax=Priestia megaterium TaxID=1404 RepID=UPI00203A4CB5|nr:MarR family transcriptional regulator [Priestia megaterium]MCM3186385.1 MarR family transcriptional regulator [Priestia megaterium]
MENANFIRESIHFLNYYVKKNLQKQAEKLDITVPQMLVINEVFKHQNISIKKISQNLSMTHSTVSEVIERLKKRDILIKTPSPKDKRSVDISLTDDANRYVEDNQMEFVNRSIVEALNHLSPNEQETVIEGTKLLMKAVIKELHKIEEKDENAEG